MLPSQDRSNLPWIPIRRIDIHRRVIILDYVSAGEAQLPHGFNWPSGFKSMVIPLLITTDPQIRYSSGYEDSEPGIARAPRAVSIFMYLAGVLLVAARPPEIIHGKLSLWIIKRH